MKKIRILLLSMLSFTLLIACSNDNEQKENSNGASSENNSLIVSLPPSTEPVSGFDPTEGWGRYGVQLFQSTLLKRNNELEVEPDLATDYSVSEDGLVWTFELRKDVKFSDGEDLTTDDVIYTFNQAKDSGTVVDLNRLEEIEATNDNEVVFTLDQPHSSFVNTVISIGIVPEHLHDENYGTNPVGTGPVQLVEYQEGEQVIVEPNPEYYGDPIQFDKITFVWMEDNTSLASAQANDVDVAYLSTNSADQDVENMEKVTLESVDNRGIAYVMVPDEDEETEDGYPIGNDVTSDYSIRRAIDLALDRDSMIKGIVKGYGQPATSVADQMPWWNEELENIIDEYGDVEKAEEELDENGWEMDEDEQVRIKDGVRAEFDLIYLAEDSIRQAIAINVADQLKPIGINVEPVGLSWDETEKLMHSMPLVMGWGGYDPIEMYNLYHSDARGVDFFNTGYYSNQKVDEYMDKALSAVSEDEANEYWKKAHWDGETGFSSYGDIAWTWLMNIEHVYLVDEDLEMGQIPIQPHGSGWSVLGEMEKWHWINTEN